MTDRDKLKELLKQAQDKYCDICAECAEDGYKDHESFEDFFADYLLANGVIVPPCKVGDKVWLINNPREYEVLNFHWTGQLLWATLILIEEPTIMREINTDHFGKTVFLTREEAERKLKELKE